MEDENGTFGNWAGLANELEAREAKHCGPGNGSWKPSPKLGRVLGRWWGRLEESLLISWDKKTSVD